MSKINPPSSHGVAVDFAPLDYHTPGARKSIDLVGLSLSVWKQLVCGLLLGILLGSLWYVYKGPVYSASTKILVSKKAAIPQTEGGNQTFGDRGEHVHLIKSPLIVKRAYQLHELDQLPAFATAKEPIQDIIDDLTVKRSAGEDRSFINVLDITYKHGDKRIGAEVVQAIVDAYEEYLDETSEENSNEVVTQLQEKAEELEEVIRRQKDEYLKFRSDKPLYMKAAPGATNGLVGQTMHPDLARVNAIEKEQRDNLLRRADLRAKKSALATMLETGEAREVIEMWIFSALAKQSSARAGTGGTTSGEGGLGMLASPPGKAALDSQLLTTSLARRRLLQTFGEDHADVLKLDEQLNTIKDFYHMQGLVPPQLDPDGRLPNISLARVYMTTLEQQISECDQRDLILSEMHISAVTRAKEVSLVEVEDQERSDELARTKKFQEVILHQLSNADLSRDHAGYNLRQISDIAIELDLKRILKMVGAFAALGILGMFAISYLREWQDTTLRTLDEIRQLTRTPVVGTVPHFLPLGELEAVSARDSGIDPVLCYYHRPGSAEAEAYRSIRTSLSFSTADREDVVVQVSSCEPGDGKTTTIANLAIAIAQSGKRTLLVDADLRRPIVHVLFGLQQEVGLAETLLGEIDWINAVRTTPVDGLSVMTSGTCPENPAELLTSPELEQFLRTVRREYDVVLIDTPPLLAVTDPCIVSQQADGMLLVARMNKNKRAAMTRAKEIIDAHGIHLLGVVANDMEGVAHNAYYDNAQFRTHPAVAPVEPEPPVLVGPANSSFRSG